jgi:hypothetical protein
MDDRSASCTEHGGQPSHDVDPLRCPLDGGCSVDEIILYINEHQRGTAEFGCGVVLIGEHRPILADCGGLS